MGKSKKNKTQNSNNSGNVNKKGNDSKKEKNAKSETAKKSETVAKDVSVPVQTENEKRKVEKLDNWEFKVPEDFDKELAKHKATVVKHTKEKDRENVPSPGGSNVQEVSDSKSWRVTKPNYDDFDRNAKKKSDDGYDNFMKLLGKGDEIEYTKVEEINEDLFKMPKDYSLAHCVAEDLNMGSGIAVQFSNQFKRHGELNNQRERQGGLAILSFPDRFIYYLVTKKYSNGKPTLYTLWNSLTKMQKHVQENSIKQVAIPRIGCGLDRLEWYDVKFMIEHIFKDTDVKITVCNFQQEESAIAVTAPRTGQKCKIFNVSYPVVEIAAGTMVVYFGTEDGHIDKEMEEVDQKFRILTDYRRGPRTLGQVVQTNAFNWNFLVFGFIVKKSNGDVVDYQNYQKCAQEVNKINKKFQDQAYEYLALNIFRDPPNEDMMFHRVLNILRSTLRNVDVYVCYPKHLTSLMPKERSDF